MSSSLSVGSITLKDTSTICADPVYIVSLSGDNYVEVCYYYWAVITANLSESVTAIRDENLITILAHSNWSSPYLHIDIPAMFLNFSLIW